MKVLIKTFTLVSLINLFSCSNPTSYKNIQEWSGDRAGETSKLILSEINSNLYDFNEEIKSKNGEIIKIAGTLTFDKGEAQLRYTKPGNSYITAKHEISDDGKTFSYKVLTSDTPLALPGNKYIYIKK